MLHADVAQSVAHLIGSEEVTGPIPVISSEKSLEFSRLFLVSQEISSCDTKSLRQDAQLAERNQLLCNLLARKKMPSPLMSEGQGS